MIRTILGAALAVGIAGGGLGADTEHHEGHRRAALRCAAHHLGADLGYRQHVPGHAGGARLGRQDADPLSRQIVDRQPGRQDLHLQAARRRDLLQRQEVHRRGRHLHLQAAEGPRDQGSVRLARRQHQGAARARSLHRRIRAGGAVLRAAAAAHHVHQRHPQQGQCRGAGQGLRHQGRRRHRAVVLRQWQPRTEIVLKRHDAYRWGPSMYKNKGPVKFEKLVIKIVPEDSSRVAAMMSGQFDITHQFPSQFIAQAKAAPMLTVTEAKPNFQLLYFGFKTTRPMVADRRVREAMSIAINRAEIAKAHPAGQCRSRLHLRRSRRARLRSRRPRASSRKTSSGPRSCSTKPAGRSAPTASARRTA